MTKSNQQKKRELLFQLTTLRLQLSFTERSQNKNPRQESGGRSEAETVEETASPGFLIKFRITLSRVGTAHSELDPLKKKKCHTGFALRPI